MLKRTIMLILSIFLLFCVQTAAFADADYRITNYSMDITVLPDGSAEITENLIYEFDGEYNGIVSLFDTDGIDGIEDFYVYADGSPVDLVDFMAYEDNTYIITEDGSLAEIRVYSPGYSDTRLFTYEYRMLGVADRYEDAGMILRKFIGANNSVSLQNAVVTVRFPESGEIRAFVHGGMSESAVTVGADYVSFGPATVYPDNSVEMRLLFPAEWIPDAPLNEGGIVEAALSEEQRIAEEAARLAAFIRTAKYVFTAAYTLLFFLTWLLMAMKYGLKGKLRETADAGRLSNYPAAFAAVAVEGAADTDALSGTLMELVQQGYVRMEPDSADVRFTILNRNTAGLHPHQAKLLSWLFGSCDSLLLSDLNAGSSYERARAFEQGYDAYCNQVSDDMLSQSLRYRNDGLRIFINALIIIVGALGVGFILVAGTPNVPLGLIVALMLFFLIYLMSRVRTLTDEGELLQMDANALKSADLSQNDHLIAFLPYYTALGMTEPLVQAVERYSGDHYHRHDPMPFYLYAGWHHGLHTLSSSMRDTHHHNASIPDPNASLSSHSGGGSNGGGGGHGAW